MDFATREDAMAAVDAAEDARETRLALADVYAAEATLAEAAVAILGPNTLACALCGAPAGSPCRVDCVVTLIDPTPAAAALIDPEPIGCDDCGAGVTERCRRNCARYCDL